MRDYLLAPCVAPCQSNRRLIGLAAAAHQAHQATQTTQTTQVHAAVAKTAQDDTEDSGYGYEEAPTYAIHYTPKISVCFSGCSAHAPCYNKHTGQCAPKACAYESEPTYYGGRKLTRAADESKNEYGYEAPEPEARYEPMQYGEEPPTQKCGCPDGFRDSSEFYLHKNTVLWVAFGLLFLPAFIFLWRGLLREMPADKSFAKFEKSWEEVSMVQICAGVVCSIASLAYLTMSLGHGYITKCDGRSFYYARYVDWMLTTPLMLWDLCVLGKADSRTRLFIIVMDVLMIGSGLIGGLIESKDRWAFFGFSMAAFLPIIYFLCWLDSGSTGFEGLLNTIGSAAGDPRGRTFRRAMNLTVLSWLGYPVIWAVAEGSEVISANGEAIAYTILDIISKSVFGYILVFSEWGDFVAAAKKLVNYEHNSSVL